MKNTLEGATSKAEHGIAHHPAPVIVTRANITASDSYLLGHYATIRAKRSQ